MLMKWRKLLPLFALGGLLLGAGFVMPGTAHAAAKSPAQLSAAAKDACSGKQTKPAGNGHPDCVTAYTYAYNNYPNKLLDAKGNPDSAAGGLIERYCNSGGGQNWSGSQFTDCQVGATKGLVEATKDKAGGDGSSTNSPNVPAAGASKDPGKVDAKVTTGAKDACKGKETETWKSGNMPDCVTAYEYAFKNYKKFTKSDGAVDSDYIKDVYCNGRSTSKVTQADCITGASAGATVGVDTKGDASKIASASGDSADSGDNCSGVFGWAICPMLEGAEDAVKWIEDNFIAPFYHTQPLKLDCGSMSASERASTEGCAEYNVWVAIRNLSNIFFVLIFLAFIFANTLSFNLDSYAVKKMLPKLIAAVIIVQFSYLFMAFAIDVTNVLGQGIGGIIDASIPKNLNFNVGVDQGGAALGVSVAVGAAAAVGVATAISSGAIWVVVALAFLAMLGVFFTLIFRQILIVMLVISAPIAIACMVLPNTEKIYKIWLSTLIKVLLMYPLIMLIFGSSKLLSLAAGINGGAFAAVIRLVVTVIPLFLIPFTFKWAGGIMNTTSSAIQKRSAGYSKKVNDSDWAKERRTQAGIDKRSLAAGTGISMMGRNIGSGRAGRFLGRATAVDPGGTRARSKLNTDRGVFDKQMEAANLSHDDLNMAIGGRAYRDEQIRLAGNDQTKKDKLNESYNRTKPYHGNKVAAQAAALRIADQGGVSDNTRTALKTAFGPTPAGMAAGAAVWGEVGRKAGDKQLHLQAVNFNTGSVEISTLKSKVAGKDAKKLAGQGTDFWRAVQTAENTPGVGGAGSVLDSNVRTQLSAPGKLSTEAADILAGTATNSDHWGGEASNPTINVVP